MRAELDLLVREADVLNQKFNESITNLKNDITMDMNNRKSEIREESKVTDVQIQDIHHELIVKLSDLRTGIETTKMETTRRVICKKHIFFSLAL